MRSHRPTAGSPDGFRPDVEGLRALAIGLVLLAHAGVPFAAGGYVGVDVFFVISGFLITRLLMGELDRSGSVSLLGFYARRIKRLMPQALLAIVAVIVLARLLLSPLRADAVAGDVMAAALSAMNWHLSSEAADYFAAGTAGPLDHFWSLAVEEQFYLLWPLLLLGVTWPWRRRGARANRVVLVVLVVIATASLSLAVQLVAAGPEQAYFSTPARAWELAAGALLAVALEGRRLGRRAAAAAAWCGLAAIAYATVTFDEDTAVPGAAALVPVLGAAALVAAGSGATPAAPTRALTRAPAQYVGRRSYAWYVWHWPVLVFAGAAWGPLSTLEGVAVTAASLLPALLTYRWIEEPLRRSRVHARMPRATLAAAPAGASLAVILGLALAATLPTTPTLAEGDADGAARLERTSAIQRSARALRPSPRDADADRSRAYHDGCLVPERPTRSPGCVYGDRGAPTTVVLFGDSHAMQYFPALQRIAGRRHWRLVELTKAACPPAAVRVHSTILGRAYPECDAWREHALRRIGREERPAMIVVTGSARYTVLERGRELDRAASTRALAAGYVRTLERLRPRAPGSSCSATRRARRSTSRSASPARWTTCPAARSRARRRSPPPPPSRRTRGTCPACT